MNLTEILISVSGQYWFVDQAAIALSEYSLVFVPLAAAYLWFGPGHKDESMAVVASSLVCLLGSYLLSGLFYHPNPPRVFDTVAPLHFENGFPSQHTALVSGAAAGTYLSQSRRLQFVAVLTTFLTGVSRVYTGEHWVLDVAASWLLGVPVYFAVAATMQKAKSLYSDS
jgi:undecaprenyl-diphosphatase